MNTFEYLGSMSGDEYERFMEEVQDNVNQEMEQGGRDAEKQAWFLSEKEKQEYNKWLDDLAKENAEREHAEWVDRALMEHLEQQYYLDGAF